MPLVMGVIWKYVLFLVWLSYLIIIGLLLFTRGFLLNRDVLSLKSSCRPVSNHCENLYRQSAPIKGEIILDCTEEEVMSNQLTYTTDSLQLCSYDALKVVIIIIDALRYDFMVHNNASNVTEILKPYQNKLTVINDLLTNSPQNSRLYQFIADPPTTTMQRINGLTTGSLPTFIDIGSNFASSEINEDNFIDQLVRYKKNIVFMGDDTWTNLYPGRFTREFPYPSFDVWDLDTVDSGVKEHLFPEIVKNDWDLIIAHFLGVDHCGHRYGPNHPEMDRKLKEMNDVFRNVSASLDKNTILFVMGDHGMTDTGDHGGDSLMELTTALFVYSPNQTLMAATSGIDIVRQIDVVPTLSSILGIPVPFSNLGTVILNALPAFGSKADIKTNWNYVILSLWTNVKQATLYIQEYSKAKHQFSEDKLNTIFDRYQILRLQIEDLVNEEELTKFISDARTFLKTIREMCEEVWVQFDSFAMSRGLVLEFLTLAFTFLLVEGIPGVIFQEVISGECLMFAYAGCAATSIIVYVLHCAEVITQLELSVYFATSTYSIAVMAIIVSRHWTSIADNWYTLSLVRDRLNLASRIILLLSVVGLFSNSFVIEESAAVSFLLITLIWISVFESKPEPTKKSKSELSYRTLLYSKRVKVLLISVLLSALIRASWFYWRCRDENSKDCMGKQSLSNSSQCLLTIISLAVFVTSARICLRSCGNLVGFSLTVFVSRYAPTIATVSCGGYWILNTLPTETKWKLFIPWQLQILPRTVLATTLVSMLILFIRPLTVYHLNNNHDGTLVSTYNVIPALFHQLKHLMIHRTGNDLKGYPIVFGLATAYSATFLNAAIFLCLLAAILLGSSLASSSVLLILTLAVIATYTAVLRHSKVIVTAQLLLVPWWAVVCWGLSSIHFFYATGHQASFSSLQWDAAYLFSTQVTSPYVPGALILANTFASHALHALLLPSLLIAPFTLSLFSRHSLDNIQSCRAELLLFEYDRLLSQGLFNLAVRYILFHGFRVFACMLAATIHSRHLMVWAIFAPKLIFESVALAVSLPCILLGLVLVQRITSRIDALLRHLEQQRSC